MAESRENRLYIRGVPYGCPHWKLKESMWNCGVWPKQIFLMRGVPWLFLAVPCVDPKLFKPQFL